MSVWVQSADQTRQEACVVLQDMLSEVGITVSVEPMDGTVMDDTIVKGGDFDACSSCLLYTSCESVPVGRESFPVSALESLHPMQSSAHRQSVFSDCMLCLLYTSRCV